MEETVTLESTAGLSTVEARERAKKFGPNTIREQAAPYWRVLLPKFWAPVPWLLEAAIVLQIGMGAYIEAAVVGALLVFNAVLGIVQEHRAGVALAALKQRLEPNALVCRDGQWTRLPAVDLVPGDAVQLALGGVVPADVRVTRGSVMVDQSMLTGESVPVEVQLGGIVHAGSLVRSGRASAMVTATGARTYFGRTVELVRIAHAPSSEQHAVLAAVKGLGLVNGIVALVSVGYAYLLGFPGAELMRLALTALLATVPVALPATFTLTAALSALALSRRGALLTRLSAVHEAAAMDVLCSDKTGTLTQNALEVEETSPMPGFDRERLLFLAAMASSRTGDDPLDAAVQRAAASLIPARYDREPTRFVPFDPETKISEAYLSDDGHEPMRVVKGALQAIEQIADVAPGARAKSDELANQGHRIIAVAVGAPGSSMQLAGLIALSDPPRADSAQLIGALKGLGVRTVMVTGDSAATASVIAGKVGLRPTPYPAAASYHHADLQQFDVYARVLPEDKYRLVEELQHSGHVVGMCGDGANDAPALSQAQVGIAVSSATDAAKAAAAIVLTEPGLAGILSTVHEGRSAFRRLQIYALNMLVKKIEVVLLLAYGLVVVHRALLTPMMMVLLLVTNDFLTMSLTTDRARPAPAPSVWHMRRIVTAATIFGSCKLLFSGGIVAAGALYGRFPIRELQSLSFLAIAFGNQAVLYVLRERGHLWHSRPGRWLLLSSAIDVTIVSGLVLSGTLMARLPWSLVGAVAMTAIGFALLLDQLKIPVEAALRLR
ncbi:HAD-IC family P-type ATPase [Burkholderia contaminans]|uniref:HAD-IC family P-type ATPase n=1 Tax=Burkholderia contaminans TaxID=488447 RepID=UPI00086382D0|nr:HAD-IC family P-type ATPase [Burkholderia contaminans]AOL08539.1 divalent cation transporter [Burkholderia contaminans]